MWLKNNWIAGILILIISWCSYQGYESLYFFNIPLYLKHAINFLLLTMVGCIGYFSFLSRKNTWIAALWLLVYLVVIALMAFVGVLDLIFKLKISSFRELIHGLRMFFTSPVPYAIVAFVKISLQKQEQV